MKRIFTFIVILCAFCAFAAAKPDSNVIGYYAWDKTPNGILKMPLKNFKNPEYKRKFWETHKKLVDSNKRKYIIIELIFDDVLPKSRVPKPDSAEKQLHLFFDSDDNAKTYPELLYAIVPSEEHTGAQIPTLNHIYDYIKKNWKVQVFQWLSEPLPPTMMLKADGWIFDAYSLKGETAYRHFQKFVLTGKTVIPILWAAESGMDGYFKDGFAAIQKNATQKVAYCKDLNLPVFWFAVCRKHGSVGCWMSDKPPFPEMRKFFAEVVKKSAPDLAVSIPETPFAITKDGTYSWSVNLVDFDFVNQCKISNANNLQLTEKGLYFKNNAEKKPALEWFFRSGSALKNAQFNLLSDGKSVTLGYSFDGVKFFDKKLNSGENWSVNLQDKKAFYCKLSGSDTTVKKFAINIKGEPLNPIVKLSPDASNKYVFDEKLIQNYFSETLCHEIGKDQVIKGSGFIGILGQKGRGATWEGVQKIEFAKPVTKLNIEVKGVADKRNWNSSLLAGLSRDGKNVKMQTGDTGKRNQKIVLKLEDSKGIKECYLHFKLINGSGVFRDKLTPARLYGYTLSAE